MGPEGIGPVVEVGGGGEWLDKLRRKDVTYKGEPTGVDRGVINVKGRERGMTGRGKMRKKRDCGVGLQGTTGTWGAG